MKRHRSVASVMMRLARSWDLTEWKAFGGKRWLIVFIKANRLDTPLTDEEVNTVFGLTIYRPLPDDFVERMTSQ